MRRYFNLCVLVLVIILTSHGGSFAGGGKMEKTITLKGSYYEIGKGWGDAFKGKMENVVRIELGVISKFYGVPVDSVVASSKKYLPVAESYDPDFMEVLKGFADGAGMDFDTLFAIRTALELLFFTGRPSGMCTSLAITGEATQNGDTIIGQNIDWHPQLPLAMLQIEWPNGVKQLSLSLGGIWEYSLSCPPSASPYGVAATLTATPDSTLEEPKIPISIMMNKASRQLSLEHAMAVFKGNKMNLACFLAASGKREIRGIELGLNGFEMLEPKREMLVHANHYISERFKPHDIFLQYVPDSPLRYSRLQHLLKRDHGDITPKHIMKYFSDHDEFPKGICAHIDPESQLPPSATVASVIMLPKQKIMYVAIGNPCENEYRLYELD